MPADRPLRAALYARVSTTDQTTENQTLELRRYVEARGWTAAEYLDTISGTKERRPALDRLMVDARRRRFDVLVVWRLDRLGRNLKHLIVTLDELAALRIAFTSLNEGIDTTTPAGKLELHLLAAIAEFERARIVERVRAGLARAKRDGKRLGRKPRPVSDHDLDRTAHFSLREAAKVLNVPRSILHRQDCPEIPRNRRQLSPRFQAPNATSGLHGVSEDLYGSARRVDLLERSLREERDEFTVWETRRDSPLPRFQPTARRQANRAAESTAGGFHPLPQPRTPSGGRRAKC